MQKSWSGLQKTIKKAHRPVRKIENTKKLSESLATEDSF